MKSAFMLEWVSRKVDPPWFLVSTKLISDLTQLSLAWNSERFPRAIIASPVFSLLSLYASIAMHFCQQYIQGRSTYRQRKRNELFPSDPREIMTLSTFLNGSICSVGWLSKCLHCRDMMMMIRRRLRQRPRMRCPYKIKGFMAMIATKSRRAEN